IEETAASRIEIEGPRAIGPQPLLNQTSGTGEQIIRRGGRTDNEIDVGGGKLRVLEGGLRRRQAHARSGILRTGNMAFADSGAAADPRVAGGDHGLQFLVGQYLF